MSCIKCGGTADTYRFRVLHVETLHVRDIKEKRVQALGNFEEFAVCGDCARKRYREYVDNLEHLIRTSLPFVLLMLVGVSIALLFRQELPILVFGIGMAVCGITGLYGNLQRRVTKKRELTAISKAEALERCAWECMLDAAPKKNDVNDITYIPINAETLARKNGDLMILYDLLPEIAIEAHKRIHTDAV